MAPFTFLLCLLCPVLLRAKRADLVHRVLQSGTQTNAYWSSLTAKRRRRDYRRRSPPSGGGSQDICAFKALGQIKSPANDKYQCWDVAGEEGLGRVGMDSCQSQQEHEYLLCEDGTLRNVRSQGCMDISGYVKTCEVYPELSPDQKFEVINIKENEFSFDGVPQTLFQLKAKSTGKCIDIEGNSGEGYLASTNCGDWSAQKDSWFYFRSKGAVVKSGKLQNQAGEKLCMGVAGNGGDQAQVEMQPCSNSPHQIWKLHESGDFVSQGSDHCLWAPEDGRDVLLGMCNGKPYVTWNMIPTTHGETIFWFVTKSTDKCLNPKGTEGEGHVIVWDCTDHVDNRWEFIPENWYTPVGEWHAIHSANNISYKITVEQSWSEEYSTEAAASYGATLEAGFLFMSSSVSYEVAASVSRTWSDSGSTSYEVSVSCETYDDGMPFEGGTLWQWGMKGESTSFGNLEWQASISRCARGGDPPKCPPFEKCKDEACEMCVPSMYP